MPNDAITALDDLLGRRVYNYCRNPDADKSFIILDPVYEEFKVLPNLESFSFHIVNFPTNDAFEVAVDQFTAGLHDWLKGYGYKPITDIKNSKDAIRLIVREKSSPVLALLKAVQSNYIL